MTAAGSKRDDVNATTGTGTASGPGALPAAQGPLPTDDQLFDVLHTYMETAPQERPSVRERLLRECPGAAEMIACLDNLDSLIVAGQAVEGASNETITYDESSAPHAPNLGAPGELRDQTFPRDFGEYELLSEIGRGGMGVVYRARQKDLDRVVALKMILASELASAQEVRRFYAEAQLAGRLRHPRIVGIHEIGQENGQHYFTMDFIDGRSLLDVLRGGPTDIETAVRWIASVARAVDYLHAQGVIHRDLKPANLLLDASGELFVTDFGLAKLLVGSDGRTKTGTILGTPNYMAPEQASGRLSEISPKSDVFSLGAILYELVTGRAPFAADSPLDTLLNVLEGEPTWPREINRRVPGDLARICMKCLEKNPAERYPSAAALAEDLEAFLRGEPVEGTRFAIVPRMRRWARRQPALVSRLTGLLAIMIILEVAFILMAPPLHTPVQLRIHATLGIWAAVCVLFQWVFRRHRWSEVTPYFWTTADAVLLTTLLYQADPPLGTMMAAYPLQVTVSGLFFNVWVVGWTTLVAAVAYAVLLFLRPDGVGLFYHPVLLVALLCVTGGAVAYQVHRVRALSHFYERR
jgi:serine/threonine-protein kinase